MANQCDICGKRFYRQDNHTNHMHVHAKGLDCGTCKKPHNTEEDLFVHLELVHGPQIGYACGICQKRFAQWESLVVHAERQHDPANSAGK